MNKSTAEFNPQAIKKPHELLSLLNSIPSNTFQVKVINFIVKHPNELVFAASNVPLENMLDTDQGFIKSAGQIHFDEESRKFFRITNDSSHSHTSIPFDSLQFALYEMFKASIPMANTIECVNCTNKTSHRAPQKDLSYTYYQEVIIDEFTQKMKNKNSVNQYGQEYLDSLNAFAQSAKAICKRPPGKRSTLHDLHVLAHKTFHHRHWKSRLFGDVMICITLLTGLGLAMGLIRKTCLNTTFFFSTAKTNREEDFDKHLQASSEVYQPTEAAPLLYHSRVL